MKKVYVFCKQEQGASAIEYALILAIVSVVLITTFTSVGTKLTDLFNQVATAL